MVKTLDKYLALAQQVEKSIDTELSHIQRNPTGLREFLASSSNRHRFLPDTSLDDIEFYKKVLFNRQFAKLVESQTDFDFMDSITEIEGDTDFLKEVGKKPFIFTTFHYGPIGAIGAWLQRAGFSLSMLTISEGVSKDMLHKDAPTDFEVLHADSMDVMLKMLHQLKMGKSLKVTADGMWGVTKDEERKSFVRIDFLGKTYCCKKGIPMLSYASGVPIIPVIARRDPLGKIVLRFASPIYPDRKIDKDTFVVDTLQQCYHFFEDILRKLPDQWEFWFIVDQLFEKPEIRQFSRPSIVKQFLKIFKEDKYRFNQESYDVCHLGSQKAYLFDRKTLGCFGVSNNLSRYLKALPSDGKALKNLKKHINKPLLDDLVQRKVLVEV